MPLCFLKSSSFTPAITSGTSFSILKADELSIITPPRFTISGANFWLVLPPAEAITISKLSKISGTASSTVYSLPLNVIFEPALLALERNLMLSNSTFNSSVIFVISLPTTPVAPKIAILGFLIFCPL